MFVVTELHCVGGDHPVTVTAEVAFGVGMQLAKVHMPLDPDPELDRLLSPLFDYVRDRLATGVRASLDEE